MFPIEIGKWYPFIDSSYNNLNASDVYQNSKLGEFVKGLDSYEKKAENYLTMRKELIKKSTFFGKPEKEDDLLYLINLIISDIKDNYKSIEFYSTTIKNNLDKILKFKESLPIKDNSLIEKKINKNNSNLLIIDTQKCLDLSFFNDSCFLYDNSVLMSYYLEKKTPQVGEGFGIKIRGTVNDDNYEQRIKELQQIDGKKLHIYKAPIGKWIGFNSKKEMENDEIEKELCEILTKYVEVCDEKERMFNDRVSNTKRKNPDNMKEELIETKESLMDMNKTVIKKLKEYKETNNMYLNALEVNIKKYKEFFNKELSEEIMKDYNIISQSYMNELSTENECVLSQS